MIGSSMIDGLRAQGVLTSLEVEDALRTVPRHLFVESVDEAEAYANVAITVKTDADGTALSSISQPTIVALMLEMARLSGGQRVLEIGTGTGYNAALLAHLVGSDGAVVSVELEADLAASARRRLSALDVSNVEVVHGDGAQGFAAAAPYDRVIVTTGAHAVAFAWIEQLVDGGYLVTPVVNSGGIGLIHCYLKRDGELHKISTTPCGFLPMRSAE